MGQKAGPQEIWQEGSRFPMDVISCHRSGSLTFSLDAHPWRLVSLDCIQSVSKAPWPLKVLESIFPWLPLVLKVVVIPWLLATFLCLVSRFSHLLLPLAWVMTPLG